MHTSVKCKTGVDIWDVQTSLKTKLRNTKMNRVTSYVQAISQSPPNPTQQDCKLRAGGNARLQSVKVARSSKLQSKARLRKTKQRLQCLQSSVLQPVYIHTSSMSDIFYMNLRKSTSFDLTKVGAGWKEGRQLQSKAGSQDTIRLGLPVVCIFTKQ